VTEEARRIVEPGREGGIFIGTHSVTRRPLDHFAAYVEVSNTDGRNP